jgi:hypothetical protein
VKSYVVHSKGKIMRHGTCSDALLKRQAGKGESVIIGVVTSDNQRVINGKVVDVAPSNEEAQEQLNAEVRKWRNMMLACCDWTQMIDAKLTKPKKAKWKSYRQALRDMPQNSQSITSAHDIIWPVPPE